MLITPFFKMVNSTTTKLLSPKFGLVDFKTLTPDAAFEMWQKGFDNLSITNQGAKIYLVNKSALELIALINNQTTIESVNAIALNSKLKSVKEAAKAKKQALVLC